jgi:D-glycero-beta-D-manno-heptose-7-phosphate kinase
VRRLRPLRAEPPSSTGGLRLALAREPSPRRARRTLAAPARLSRPSFLSPPRERRGYNPPVINGPALHEIVNRFEGRRVLVYGDLVLDRFILGAPKRISREAPVIILRFAEQWDLPGGGANALANITSLRGTAVPVAVVGDDEPGHTLLRLLTDRGVDVSAVRVLSGYATPTKVRLLAGGAGSLRHQVARYDIEDYLNEHEGWRRALRGSFAEIAPGVQAAAVSDYGYGTVTTEGVAVLRAALTEGAPVVADSRFSLEALHGVDGATPNLEELREIAGHELADDGQVAAAAEALRSRLAARFVLATRGSHGLTLVQADAKPIHLGVFGSDQVADVTGAGDTVLATLTLALAAGASPAAGAALANLAGGIVVMKQGTAVVTPTELHDAIDIAFGDA